MTIFIVGGSNSLMKDGWVTSLTRLLPSEQITNISIGATHSMTGLFRVMTRSDLQPGDTIVWEYALNEINHNQRGHRTEDLLRFLEHLLRLCSRRGINFAAAVFTPRQIEALPARPAYYDALLQLFAHYGVPSFDVSPRWCAANRASRFPAKLFKDAAHYVLEPRLMRFIAEGVIDAIGRACVPAEVTPRYTGATVPRLVTPQDGVPFRNTILDLTLAEVPSASFTLSQDGHILGFFALCPPGLQTGLRLTLANGQTGGRWIRISTTPEGNYERPQFRAFSLLQADGAAWRCTRGDRLEVRPAEGTGRYYAEFELRAHLSAISRPFQPSFAGFLLEVAE